jgi:hypothetical protein
MGVLICFVLMAGWFRLNAYPPLLPQWFVVRFILLWGVLITFGWWLATGMSGMAALRRDRLRAGMVIALSLLALWAVGSQTWAYTRYIRPDVAASAALAWAVVVFFMLVLTCTGSPQTVRWAVIVCGIAISIITVFQVDRQGALGLQSLGEQRFSADTASILQAEDGIFVRPHGLLPHPNMTGGFLAVCALLVAGPAVSSRGWRRAASMLCFSLFLWALLLTFSRAAWLGFATGALTLFALARIPWRLILPLAAITVLVGGVFWSSYETFLQARAGASGESVELRSISDRIVFTGFAVRAIGEQPLVGLGAGAFPWRSASYISETFYDLRGEQVHNIFLAAWAELGIVGLGLLVTALILGAVAALRAIRQERMKDVSPMTRDKTARAAFLAAAAAFGVIGLFDHYPYGQLPMMALWWGCLTVAGSSAVQTGSGQQDGEWAPDEAHLQPAAPR